MTKNNDEAPVFSRYWGKTSNSPLTTDDRFHLLCWHSLDVAACGYQMVITNRFGVTDILLELGFTREEGARWFG